MSSKRSGSVCVTEWSVTPLVRNKELPIASPRERRSLGTLKQTESPRAKTRGVTSRFSTVLVFA
jgi:hypothetical protein